MSRFKITPSLWDKIHHFASFPQTGVSLQQMILFGQNPSQGTLLKASQFLAEELPIRLSHRVKELDELPDRLNEMESIKRVKEWYAESFQELIEFPPPKLTPELRDALWKPQENGRPIHFPHATPNPSLHPHLHEGTSAGPLPPPPPPPGWKPQISGNMNPSPYAPGDGSGASLTAAPGSSEWSGDGTTKDGWKFGEGGGSMLVGGTRFRVPLEKRYFSPPAPNVKYPPEVHEYNDKFTRALEKIKKRHDPTVTTVAQGILEWKRSQNTANIGHGVQAFLDRFYMTRIGIRFLIGQHIALNTLQSHPDYVGIICTKSNVHDICHDAIENARFVCEEHYALFKGPPIQLLCPKDLTFPYVPGHLSHICFELLKNSLRAVVERYGVENEDNYPPIRVVVVEGKEDITIKISDEGGGIPRSAMPQIWTYMYTTMADSPDVLDAAAQNDFKAPMAGFGYGLPLSRLYARYFGGDLRLISMEGYGTDVYIHLNRLSGSSEPLQ
jgi:pyruvate dehydrogenase kinase 2/3/4